MISEKSFWYIAAQSHEVSTQRPLGRKILGEWLVLFRGSTGKVVCMQDRCIHRNAQLSRGTIRAGRLICPYHGWAYGDAGKVVNIPSEGPGEPRGKGRCGIIYECLEQDDYVYVRLAPGEPGELPYRIPCYGKAGYAAIRLSNRFENTVTNCVENFVDIPHTAFVHPRIFRNPRNERFTARVVRAAGSVRVEYANERANFGIFSRFLNRTGKEIRHFDNFHMPNITCVEYEFGPHRHFFITSQSIPVTDEETLVYTDLTYDYGFWNWLARPIIRRQAQAIIDQDIVILKNQMESIRRYGSLFQNSAPDIIHVMVESIRDALQRGENPKLLPEKTVEFEFWV